jgi:hypothetical protein
VWVEVRKSWMRVLTSVGEKGLGDGEAGLEVSEAERAGDGAEWEGVVAIVRVMYSIFGVCQGILLVFERIISYPLRRRFRLTERWGRDFRFQGGEVTALTGLADRLRRKGCRGRGSVPTLGNTGKGRR